MINLHCVLFTNASHTKKNLLLGRFILLLRTIIDQARIDFAIGFLLQNLPGMRLCILLLWDQKVVGLKCRYEVNGWMKLQKKDMRLITNTNKEPQVKQV